MKSDTGGSTPGTVGDTGGVSAGNSRGIAKDGGIMTTMDCIPCFLRQALDSARLSTDDAGLIERIMRGVLLTIGGMDLNVTPPLVAQQVHRTLRAIARSDDPYREAKDRHNRMALDMLPGFRSEVESAADPLEMATRLSIAGNVIDLGAKAAVGHLNVGTALNEAVRQPLLGDLDGFREAVERAGKILFLTDNAGEIVFDRLLLERLPKGRTVVAVRGRPVINDATIVDARAAGIHEVAEVIDNGSDAPGTVLPDCSPEFRKAFWEADVIISKGQGNFETLSGIRAPVYFLFKVKCPVIAAHAGLPLGTHVLRRSRKD